MKTDFVAATAVLLSIASGEMDQMSLQAVGKEPLSVGTVSQVVHQLPWKSNALC